jgi:MFS family permease
MAIGGAVSFATMLLTRLGLGVGEAPFAPVTYRSVRAWAPYTERGTAIAAISAGSSLGLGASFRPIQIVYSAQNCVLCNGENSCRFPHARRTP